MTFNQIADHLNKKRYLVLEVDIKFLKDKYPDLISIG